MKIAFRKATFNDLVSIVSLLAQDNLGKMREQFSDDINPRYVDAFNKIDSDPNQYLMVAELKNAIIATCHCTILPSLTFIGSMRMQIEAVRVHHDMRGKKIGEQMINHVIEYGKSQGASIFQLSTNKQRADALRFYEGLGFKTTHEGMKLYLDINNT